MDNRVQQATQLWSEVNAAVSPYPHGVLAVPEPLKGTAFFPGGLGLWVDGEQAPLSSSLPRVLIVGQDFNTLRAYNRFCRVGTEVGFSATWRNLLPILSTAGVPCEACVFTNFYMGLRESGPESGQFAGAKDPSFKERCASFFIRQVNVWKPTLILTLGLPTLIAVAGVFGERAPDKICDCDFIFHNLCMGHGLGALVALTHPSYYRANIGRRRYRDLEGATAEQAMITDGLTASGMTF